jgi:sugar phosphate isomerase/epimerase
MAETKVGLQLIVYGGRQSGDLVGVLEEVAEAGYAGFEGGTNMLEDPGPGGVNKVLAQTGLALCGVHSGYGAVADLDAVARYCQALRECDSRYLICSGVAPGEGIEQYEKAAETFNLVGAQCTEAGVVFCYHNHAWEFESFGGVKGIHRLAELTDPALVKFCTDVYWVHVGGEDPAEFVRRYADRAGYYHFKDGEEGVFIELGQGKVDLVGSKDAALEVGADWIVCEQDRTELEPGESISQSRDYLRKLGL